MHFLDRVYLILDFLFDLFVFVSSEHKFEPIWSRRSDGESEPYIHADRQEELYLDLSLRNGRIFLFYPFFFFLPEQGLPVQELQDYKY